MKLHTGCFILHMRVQVCEGCIYVRVSVAVCRCCGCFPLCVLGARTGLSVTVKWEGVGDDRCRRVGIRGCERDG